MNKYRGINAKVNKYRSQLKQRQTLIYCIIYLFLILALSVLHILRHS